jgi:RNA polymerase sigma-70 factor (ECF subfamily)
MSEPTSQDVTQLLKKWSDGDKEALEALTPIVYGELHKIAHRYMGRERAGHSLQTTALVNEAYIRLIDWKNAKFENRAHFFGVSAHLMRRILVDFARKRKRGVDTTIYKVSLGAAADFEKAEDWDLVEIDEALSELAEFDERKAKIVEMKFFGGLKTGEIAEVLGVAEITVLREWQKAKAWLYVYLTRSGD